MALSLAEALLYDFGVRKPADINLIAFAEHQNARVQFTRLSGCEAQIVGVKDKAIIQISSATNRTRQRFSIAHELGHWNLHRGLNFRCSKNQIGSGKEQISANEREADRFAADLILPDYVFLPLSDQMTGKGDPSGFYEIADLFQASLETVLLKWVYTAPLPTTVLYTDESGRRWFRHSRHVQPDWFLRETNPELPPALSANGRGRQQWWAQSRSAGDWYKRCPDPAAVIYEIHFKRWAGSLLTLLLPLV